MSFRTIASCVLALLATRFAVPDEVERPATGTGVFITPQQADALRAEGAVVLDTRGRLAFAVGHAPGAVRVDWRDFSDPDQLGRLDPDVDRLRQRIEALGVDGDRPIVVMGDWHRGWGEEGRIFWMLDSLGHPHVRIVEGGHRAWVGAGLEVTRSSTAPQPGSFEFSPRIDALASLEDLDHSDVTLLDVRERSEYDGATPYGASRGGHVPGAQHLDWRSVFDGDGRLLPVADLERLLPGPDQRVVAYCTGGVRSGFLYAVMRSLGRTNVANYAGSWWEYADSPLPAE